MVSIRRRRSLGLCSGKSSFPVELPTSIQNGNTMGNPLHAKPVSVHPLPPVGMSLPELEKKLETYSGFSASGSNTLKEEPNNYFAGKEVKRRKRHRRKHHQDQEPCIMRGVYFKNMKWQAAIKVDKKQIHLGTVGSQEEAARLYDRAAFMCGREPNFKLSEEEKRELRQYKWDEFLDMTRSAINIKKNQKKLTAGRRKKQENQMPTSDLENERGIGSSSMSEDDGEIDN